MGINTGSQTKMSSWIPGETAATTVRTTHGALFFDINGEQEPNVLGKDRFILPLNKEGIQYDAPLNTSS